MASTSLRRWRGERSAALNEIEAAHRSVGGGGRGRRYATEQINHAYAVLLSSQFQGFCRDLHSEAAEFVASSSNPASARDLIRAAMTQFRTLDRGNPNPGNVGQDFNRFGILFWEEVRNRDVRSITWQDRLEELNRWRNAIAHQHFDRAMLAERPLRLDRVREWRRACSGIAQVFDAVLRTRLTSLFGLSPW
ncbi:MAG TPA: hypothetical protein VH475_11745 [Tepidisphaeraceae bacterium]|jgi:hypothetical protein